MSDSGATTNLMQMKAKVSSHYHDAKDDKEGSASRYEDDVTEESKAWAESNDVKILIRMMHNQTVTDEEREGFFARSKIFFKEPLGEDKVHDFCWKHAYNRGKGTVPKACPSGTKKGDATSWLPICYQDKAATKACPKEYKDHGLICRGEMYGRGFGFLSEANCKKSPAGKELGCEKFGGVIHYAKCKAGFAALGPVCKPKGIDAAKCKKDCGAGSKVLGGIACTKEVDFAALKPAYPDCPADQVMDTAMCWPKCKDGYSGLSKLCWQKPHGEHPEGCFAGLAKSKLVCATVTGDQVFTVFKCVTNLATAGVSDAAFKATEWGAIAGKVGEIEAGYTSVMNALAAVESADIGDTGSAAAAAIDAVTAQSAIWGKTVVSPLKALMEDDADSLTIIRESASFIANWEPTGVAQAIRAFTWPICDHE